MLATDANGHVDMLSLLRELGGRGVLSLLVEGGGVLHGSLFEAKLVDKGTRSSRRRSSAAARTRRRRHGRRAHDRRGDAARCRGAPAGGHRVRRVYMTGAAMAVAQRCAGARACQQARAHPPRRAIQ